MSNENDNFDTWFFDDSSNSKTQETNDQGYSSSLSSVPPPSARKVQESAGSLMLPSLGSSGIHLPPQRQQQQQIAEIPNVQSFMLSASQPPLKESYDEWDWVPSASLNRPPVCEPPPTIDPSVLHDIRALDQLDGQPLALTLETVAELEEQLKSLEVELEGKMYNQQIRVAQIKQTERELKVTRN